MMPFFSILLLWMLSGLLGKAVQSKEQGAPRISIKPSRAFSLGDNGTIVCEGPLFGSKYYYLEKDGQEISSRSGLGKTSFHITNTTREDGGMYTCYHKDLKSQSLSPRSESVELLIREPALPRPTIDMYPSRMAPLGGKLTIICEAEGPSKRFYLNVGKDEETMELHEKFAYFRIDNIQWDNGNSYFCNYSPQSGFFVSEPSNTMELLIVDPKFPRPSISLSPMDGVMVGRNVTINCHSHDVPKSFYLQKMGSLTTDVPMQTDGTTGKFLISNASGEHRGNYSCCYQPRSGTFSVSEPSDLVELLITDPYSPRPTISLSPSGIAPLRSNITIHCSTNASFLMFHLYKSRDPMKSHPMEPDGDMARFSINNMSTDHSGLYHCCYRPTSQNFSISKPSKHVELLVLDPSLPRPGISIIPSGLAALGGQVNIRCESQEGPAEFFLHKAEDSRPKWPMKSDWDVGEFSISNLSWEHQGNYSCSYALDKRPYVLSSRSDPVELLVSETPETPDYTPMNTLRFAIGGLILLLLAYIVIGF